MVVLKSETGFSIVGLSPGSSLSELSVTIENKHHGETMTKSNLKIVRDEIVNVGFDVSAETLNWTVLLPGDSQIDGECLNTTDGITDTLNSLQIRTT